MSRPESSNSDGVASVDTCVVGAGFGGLAAALRLAERGQSVRLHERLRYPGGCASSFERDGFRFEAGATLFSGLERGQLFGDWIARHDLDVTVDWIDPLVEFRCGSRTLRIPRQRSGLLDARVGRQRRIDGGERPGFHAETAHIRSGDWTVAAPPKQAA